MRKLFIFLLTLSFGGSVCAQQTNSALEEYGKRIRQNISSYNLSLNKKYSEYLNGIWERYESYVAFPLPDEDIFPVIYNESDTATIGELHIDKENISIEQYEQHKEHVYMPPYAVDNDEEAGPDDATMVSFAFYNTIMQAHSVEINVTLNSNSNQSIAELWEYFTNSPQIRRVYDDCWEIRRVYNLGDWAFLELAHLVSETICDNSNERVLLTAYLLVQSGFDVKIGRRQGELHLFFSSENEIYNRRYFVIDNIRYYPYINSSEIDEMEICNTPRQLSHQFSLAITQEQKFNSEQLLSRIVKINDSFSLKLHVNQNLLDFYSSYPTSRIAGNDMTRWAIYAQTPLDVATREELYAQLTSLISGKNELEAANMLLNFVQTGFVYKYDEEVWGRDRAFFAEESLAYPYCDCEDRSILFSHLMRDLLGLDVALVYSPGHLFTAVRFTDNVEGAYISIGEDKYVVCEPTCTNGAPVGWISAESENSDVKVIKLSKIDYGKSYRLSFNEPEYKRSLFPVCIDGKYGYKNAEGKIVVPCEYDSLLDSEHGDKFLYGAVKSGMITLFDCDCVEHIRNVEGYIPLELNRLKDGMKGDYFAIIKSRGEWYLVNLVWGPLEADFCFSEYDMEDVSYDQNIYCEPHSRENEITDKFIILQKNDNNKYGVIELNSKRNIIPFEYDNISFVSGNKSKVRVYKSENNQNQEITLK